MKLIGFDIKIVEKQEVKEEDFFIDINDQDYINRLKIMKK